MNRFITVFFALGVCATALLIVGCDDMVTTHFDSLQEAQSNRAFERGWLPPILPESARNIIERNDLDLNTGTGSFAYDVTERPAYIERLMQRPGATRNESSVEVITLRSDKSVWELTLPIGEGKGRWSVHPEKVSDDEPITSQQRGNLQAR